MELPQALELPAGCIAAGLPVRTACAAGVQSFDGPVADDLGQVLSLMDLGVAVRVGAGEVVDAAIVPAGQGSGMSDLATVESTCCW